jgi:hypothetical protein
MYVRLVRFSVAPGSRAVAQALADDLAPKIAALPGCTGVTVFGDDADGQFGMVVQWSSRDAADAAAMVIGPQLNGLLSGHLTGALDARLFEVISK